MNILTCTRRLHKTRRSCCNSRVRHRWIRVWHPPSNSTGRGRDNGLKWLHRHKVLISVSIEISALNCYADEQIQLTPWAPIGGKAPAFGIGPTRGLFVGGGRDPLAFGVHEWSINSVLISGFGRGFLQSWCCQLRLKFKREMNLERATLLSFIRVQSKNFRKSNCLAEIVIDNQSILLSIKRRTRYNIFRHLYVYPKVLL